MQFSDDILIRVVVFVLGVSGFLVAKHIRNHKVKDAPLVCMVGFDCHTVVHSDYSKFLGIPVELLGMFYYAFLSILYFFLILFPSIIPIPLFAFLLLASLGAFIFSAYLIVIQIFVLRKGCSWCIVSALISALVVVLTVFHYDLSVIAQLFSVKF